MIILAWFTAVCIALLIGALTCTAIIYALAAAYDRRPRPPVPTCGWCDGQTGECDCTSGPCDRPYCREGKPAPVDDSVTRLASWHDQAITEALERLLAEGDKK